MKVKFWGASCEGVIGLTVEAEDIKEQKSLAKIREGLQETHKLISISLGDKSYKGFLSHWHEGHRNLFTAVTEFIQMNFRLE